MQIPVQFDEFFKILIFIKSFNFATKMTIKLVQKVMHYLGRKWFQEAGRNLIVASQSSRGPIQGGRFRNGGSIPSKGRKSTIENHSVRHSGDTFGRIAVPEFGVQNDWKLKKICFTIHHPICWRFLAEFCTTGTPEEILPAKDW